MTDKELKALAPEAINEAVARKLKGWFSKCKCEFPIKSAHHNCPAEFGNCHHADNCNLPDYCHSIEAAWEILETLISRGYGVSVDKDDAEEVRLFNEDQGWHCNLCDAKGRHFSDGYGATAPMAIARAFLKLP